MQLWVSLRILHIRFLLIGCAAWLAAGAVCASEFDAIIPMYDKGTSSYYVDGYLDGYGDIELLVDTGSSYLTINQAILDILNKTGKAEYLRDLKGSLANGNSMVVPVYKVYGLILGTHCQFQAVEAAVFPSATRLILGLNALSQSAPFIFSIKPPTLTLSNCTDP